MNDLRIAIDGGAATGKSTIAKLLAKRAGLKYINTGQLYRLVALYAFRNNISETEVERLLGEMSGLTIYYNEESNIEAKEFEFDVKELELQEVGNLASVLGSKKEVREFITIKLKEIAKLPGVVMEGRDIGTVVMPDADFKFFIVIDPEIGAERRYKQHISNNETVEYETILKELIERNKRDAEREIAPLIPTEESIIIDSSHMNPDQLVDKIIEEVQNG